MVKCEDVMLIAWPTFGLDHYTCYRDHIAIERYSEAVGFTSALALELPIIINNWALNQTNDILEYINLGGCFAIIGSLRQRTI